MVICKGMEIINKIKKTFPNLALFTLSLELEQILKDCNEILDLGCGSNSPLSFLSKKKNLVGVDGHKKSISESKKRKIHDKYYLMNILDIGSKFKRKSFDAVVALDLIEHLTKRDGIKLLKMMEKIARKKVVVLTPNGFIDQTGSDNSLQEHLSGWNTKDFKKRGYEVVGRYGLKQLRGEKASLLFRPKLFWGIVSELSHLLYTRGNPEKAFSILCSKEIK